VDIAGPVPADAIAGEIAGADLVVIPFRSGPLVRATDALKVYEALAAGRRVLVTDMPQAERFAPAVRGARGVEAWVRALDEVADGRWTVDHASTRERIAREEDWASRFGAARTALDAAMEA
jgi:glycosyltransferase involved in cell wall biosynthesis